MEFKTFDSWESAAENDKWSGGSSLNGYIDITYDELVSVFGEPDRVCDGYKVDAEWRILFEDGTIATIYNYKDGPNYNGDGPDGTPVRQITEWHIGGTGSYGQPCQSVNRVFETLGRHIQFTENK